MTTPDPAKLAAAKAALRYVQPDMKLGLGTGSTAKIFVDLLAEKAREQGWDLTCVATSDATKTQAEGLGLAISDINDVEWLDLVIDGADEIDPELRLVKGGGGAHLIEKIVANSCDEMLVIADESKLVEELGAFPLPVEVVTYGWRVTQAGIEELLEDFDVDEDAAITLRENAGAPFMTDEGHYILDLALGRIDDPEGFAEQLNLIPGVVENGLFIDMADRVIVGADDGSVDEYTADADDDL